MSEGWAWAMASMIFGGALVVRIGCEYLNRFADEHAGRMDAMRDTGRPARLFRELASEALLLNPRLMLNV